MSPVLLNRVDILVLAVIAGMVFVSLRVMHKRKRSGTDCSSCQNKCSKYSTSN